MRSVTHNADGIITHWIVPIRQIGHVVTGIVLSLVLKDKENHGQSSKPECHRRAPFADG